MAEISYVSDETLTHPNFVIASVARQSSVACARSGLPCRLAPRNDGFGGQL
jgi:hypothetical protein